jgi:hypothetical protein
LTVPASLVKTAPPQNTDPGKGGYQGRRRSREGLRTAHQAVACSCRATAVCRLSMSGCSGQLENPYFTQGKQLPPQSPQGLRVPFFYAFRGITDNVGDENPSRRSGGGRFSSRFLWVGGASCQGASRLVKWRFRVGSHKQTQENPSCRSDGGIFSSGFQPVGATSRRGPLRSRRWPPAPRFRLLRGRGCPVTCAQ